MFVSAFTLKHSLSIPRVAFFKDTIRCPDRWGHLSAIYSALGTSTQSAMVKSQAVALLAFSWTYLRRAVSGYMTGYRLAEARDLP